MSPLTSPTPVKLRHDDGHILRFFAVAVLVWSFDFKASSSGAAQSFQAVLLCIYSILVLWIVGISIKRHISPQPLLLLIFAVALFMIDSSVMGLHNRQLPYPIFVNLIPSYIYITASLVTYVTLRIANSESPSFLNLLRLACIAFCVIHVVVLLVTHGGIDLSKSRYEVLSGAVVPSLGIIAVGLIRRLSKLDLVALILNLLISLLSVTRTLLVVLAIQIVSVFLARPSAVFRSSTYKGLAVLGAGIFLIAALDAAGGTGLTDRWISRITVSRKTGTDPTALTRSAEVHYMMEHFETSTETILFGNGLAAVTSLTGPDASRAARIVGWDSLNIHSIGYGHQNYSSILFVAGLLGGGCFLLVQLANGAQSVALIRKIQLNESLFSESTVHIGLWGGVIVLGMLAVGLFGGTLGDRNACLWYGIGTGMIYWTRNEMRQQELSLKMLRNG